MGDSRPPIFVMQAPFDFGGSRDRLCEVHSRDEFLRPSPGREDRIAEDSEAFEDFATAFQTSYSRLHSVIYSFVKKTFTSLFNRARNTVALVALAVSHDEPTPVFNRVF